MFKSDDRELSKLLDQVESHEIQLPDFQRGWVWDDDRIKALLASLTKGYPIGAIMLLESGGDFHFECRNIEDSGNEKTEPKEMILDGQQRTTSMFLAMRSKKPVKTHNEKTKNKTIFRHYYLDIEKALNSEVDRIDAIIAVDENKQKRENIGRDIVLDLSSTELEYKNRMIPFDILSSSSELDAWCAGYYQYYRNNYPQEEAFRVTDEYEELNTKILRSLLSYRIPVIRIGKETPKEAVCQVFENVNQGGVSLTVFELITATFAADNFDLRADWNKIHSAFSEKGILKVVDNTSFLTALTLLVSHSKGGTVSCKRRDVLNLTLDDYKKYRDQLIDGYKRMYKLLMEMCFYRENDVPYATQFIPLSAICAELGTDIENKAVKDKIKRWMWCGILGELYGGANETRYANDLPQVIDWINGSEVVPNTVNNFSFNTKRLLGLQTRNSAAYKGSMTLILENGARDWISDSKMDFESYIGESSDIHHIFPQDYCEKQGYDKNKWNSIINKTPLYASTNRYIGGVAPSKYIEKIKKKIESNEVSERMESHLLDYEKLSSDNFDEFIAARTTKLLDVIEAATGRTISDRKSEEVIETFGREV